MLFIASRFKRSKRLMDSRNFLPRTSPFNFNLQRHFVQFFPTRPTIWIFCFGLFWLSYAISADATDAGWDETWVVLKNKLRSDGWSLFWSVSSLKTVLVRKLAIISIEKSWTWTRQISNYLNFGQLFFLPKNHNERQTKFL